MLLSILVYGLLNSAILALTAVGFSLTYGVSRLANFAYGAFYVVAGFSAWLFFVRLRLNYYLSLLLAVLVVTILGAALYRFVLMRVRGMPLSEIIVTFALGSAVLESMRYFGFVGSNYNLPPLTVFSGGNVELLGVPVDFQRLAILVLALLLTLGLWGFTRHTKTGLALRAMAQDEQAAMMLGIDSDWMATLALALGAALVGVAAVAILPLGFIAAESGLNILLYAIAVCILGGLESVAGVLVASLLIGYAQMISVAYFGPHYQMIVALLAILGTLIVKPSGLFGRQKDLEERV